MLGVLHSIRYQLLEPQHRGKRTLIAVCQSAAAGVINRAKGGTVVTSFHAYHILLLLSTNPNSVSCKGHTHGGTGSNLARAGRCVRDHSETRHHGRCPSLKDVRMCRSALVGVFSNIISPETLNTDVCVFKHRVYLILMINVSRSAWLDSRMATVYVAAFSLIGLSIHVIVNKRHPLAKRHVPVQDGVAASQNRFAQTILQHFAQYGSPAIAAYKIIRLLSITSLVVLAFLTMLSVDKNKKLLRPYLAETAAVVCIHRPFDQRAAYSCRNHTQTYADILAVLTLIVPVPISRIVSAHVTLVVLALFGVYAFRDIWPSMTFTLHPQDLSEGWLLWAKIGNSAFSAIVVPMLEPYPYIPLDPQVRFAFSLHIYDTNK